MMEADSSQKHSYSSCIRNKRSTHRQRKPSLGGTLSSFPFRERKVRFFKNLLD